MPINPNYLKVRETIYSTRIKNIQNQNIPINDKNRVIQEQITKAAANLSHRQYLINKKDFLNTVIQENSKLMTDAQANYFGYQNSKQLLNSLKEKRYKAMGTAERMASTYMKKNNGSKEAKEALDAYLRLTGTAYERSRAVKTINPPQPRQFPNTTPDNPNSPANKLIKRKPPSKKGDITPDKPSKLTPNTPTIGSGIKPTPQKTPIGIKKPTKTPDDYTPEELKPKTPKKPKDDAPFGYDSNGNPIAPWGVDSKGVPKRKAGRPRKEPPPPLPDLDRYPWLTPQEKDKIKTQYARDPYVKPRIPVPGKEKIYEAIDNSNLPKLEKERLKKARDNPKNRRNPEFIRDLTGITGRRIGFIPPMPENPDDLIRESLTHRAPKGKIATENWFRCARIEFGLNVGRLPVLLDLAQRVADENPKLLFDPRTEINLWYNVWGWQRADDLISNLEAVSGLSANDDKFGHQSNDERNQKIRRFYAKRLRFRVREQVSNEMGLKGRDLENEVRKRMREFGYEY